MMNLLWFMSGFLQSIQGWLNAIQVDNPEIAILICRLIPDRCPFQRQISLLGYRVEIPPLCKLNPLYPQLIALRLKALVYLQRLPFG
jgi:Mo-dependent nitrogenase C-terminus